MIQKKDGGHGLLKYWLPELIDFCDSMIPETLQNSVHMAEGVGRQGFILGST